MIAPIEYDGVYPESGGGGGGGTSIVLIRGCTNPNASNYNYRATIDDGSCILVANPVDNVVPYYYDTIEVDNIVNITFVSNPTNAAVFINDVDSGYRCTTSISFNAKEFLTQKIFTVKSSGFTSANQYRVTSFKKIDTTGVAHYAVKLAKMIDGVWTPIELGSFSTTLTNFSLNFDLTLDVLSDTNTGGTGVDVVVVDSGENGGTTGGGVDGVIDVSEPDTQVINSNVYRVEIIGDVSSNTIIKYTTSDGTSAFVEDDTPNIFTVSNYNSSNVAWIQLEKYGINNYTHTVSYKILNPNSSTPINLTDDFKKELVPGLTRIVVIANRLNTTPNLNTPTVTVDVDSLEFNIAGELPLTIPYSSQYTNTISYILGTTQRSIEPNGVIILTAADFSNGIGQYTLYLQPSSQSFGSGPLKRVHINVVSKTYIDGPDITKINYPYNIKGADFRGYDEDFQISWQSINTNYIEIYVTKAENSFLLERGAKSGATILNVANVLTKANKTFNDSTDVLTFDLILVPFNQEGDSVERGKEEKITIIFDKGDLRLKRAQVLYDIKDSFQKEFDKSIFIPETSKYLTHYAHFGDSDNKLIATWAVDTETFSTYNVDTETNIRTKTNEVRSLVLKLYEPLDNKFQPNQQVWISKIQSVPVLDQLTLVDEVIEICTRLTPNFNLDIGDDIGYQILDDLVASGSVSSTELIEEYIGTNEFSLENLSINYLSGSEYNWPEFVKYSSAEERVENFFYKVQLLEFHTSTYESLSSSSLATGSLSVMNEMKRVDEKISNAKKGFDAFEKLLYTKSGSLSYPGAEQTALSSSTHIDTQNWYTNIIGSARNYDKYNNNALVNNVPKHIVNDAQGQDFVLFFNMIGQHFDTIWSYINGVYKSKQLTHNYNEGMTNDLIYHMLESLGWDADMGVRSQYLWEYAFGKNKDGSSASAMSGKDRQQEIWRRLLNNLPYLYKHKGTKRALTAAMSCYGIPTSMLTILEFGGPVDPNAGGVTSFTFDDRTAAIVLDDAASILIPWKQYVGTSDFPNSVELRINTENRQDHILATTDGWEIKLLAGTGSNAAIQFTMGSFIGSSSYFPVFNDEYTQIVINRTISGSNEYYDIYGKEGFNERIRNKGYGQLIVPTGSTRWDWGTSLELGAGFSGSMDEFRLWTTPLEESRIENHTLLPDAIDGNHVSASTEDLIFRLDFEYPKDRSVTGDTAIKNVSINRSYDVAYATASNFTSVTTYPYQYIPYERTVTAMVPSTGIGFSNKVRFESQTLENYLNFGTTSNVTSFNNANDSNKLGLFFSPMREIDMDILRSLGNFNIDNYIGDPSDEYKPVYRELDVLRNYYFQRFELNIYEYIQLVRYIDQTLFTTLESLVPGRAKVSTGLLIEPHLLERSKVQRTKPIAEELSHEKTIIVSDYTEQIATFENNEVELNTIEDISFISTNPQYNGTLDTESNLPIDASTNFFDSTISVTDDDITIIGENTMYGVDIDAKIEGTVIGEYYGIQFQQIGMDPDGINIAGFGIWGSNGHTIRTRIDKDGNYIQERKKVYRIQESNVINVPENINPSDSSAGTHMVPVTFYKYRVSFLDFDQTAPIVNGNITEVLPLEGYFPSHYRYVGDVTSGLENAFFNGSKQTSATTLDGGPAVETFTTNPNTLKVSDTGRGSGEPILEVD